jgi:hypothetical protein
VSERPARVMEDGAALAHPLVMFIRFNPGMSEAMLATHRDDGSGHCTVCTAGAQSGRLAWPCQTQMAAAAAAKPAVQ